VTGASPPSASKERRSPRGVGAISTNGFSPRDLPPDWKNSA
jgi:hypothetical protein